jgi:5-methyltetrahydrofolate--homocysteine methyltransferase
MQTGGGRKNMANNQVFSQLQEMVLALNQQGVKKATLDALDQGFSAQDIILNGLAKGMKAVGERFECGEFFLPELVQSAEIMKAVLNILHPHMLKAGTMPGHKIVLATPRGDIHDIGKNILGGLLEGNGFEVCDLGVDVPPEEIVRKTQETKAEVIGLSALVSSGVSSMAETIITFKEKNIRAKVIIGGAACTPEAARTIRADGYGKDAWQGLQIIEQWVKGGT